MSTQDSSSETEEDMFNWYTGDDIIDDSYENMSKKMRYYFGDSTSEYVNLFWILIQITNKYNTMQHNII